MERKWTETRLGQLGRFKKVIIYTTVSFGTLPSIKSSNGSISTPFQARARRALEYTNLMLAWLKKMDR